MKWPLNNSLFISMCIFLRDLSKQKNPRVLCRGEFSPNFICSHVPMEVFLFNKMGKKQGNKKESCLCKGRFPYSCILLRFGNTLWRLMPSGAPHPPRQPSPRFPDPRLHFLLAMGVSRLHLAVTRFSSSPPRVYYTIVDISYGCFFGKEKRREKGGKKKV